MTTRRALLLIGSPKAPNQSTSEALGSYLLAQFTAPDWEREKIRLITTLQDKNVPPLLAAVDKADLIILSAPLYVDTAPAPVIAALEKIVAHRQAEEPSSVPDLVAITNCGFPEAAHNDTVLEHYQNFASAALLHWSGGLALGAGGAIHGESPDKVGGMAHNVTLALDQAAESLQQNQPLTAATQALIRTPMMPQRLYTLAGNLGWYWQAFKNKVLTQLNARPHQK